MGTGSSSPSNCGTNTHLKDGKCMAEDPISYCGTNTQFKDGKCKADPMSYCGANTQFKDGKCKADPTSYCGANTQFKDGKCKAEDPIKGSSYCGANTKFKDGKCMPTIKLTDIKLKDREICDVTRAISSSDPPLHKRWHAFDNPDTTSANKQLYPTFDTCKQQCEKDKCSYFSFQGGVSVGTCDIFKGGAPPCTAVKGTQAPAYTAFRSMKQDPGGA